MASRQTPCRPGLRRARRSAGALLALATLAVAPAAAELRKASVGDGTWVVLQDSTQLFVEAQARPGETLTVFARRVSERADAAPRIARANDGTTRLRSGPRYRVPLDVLRPELRAQALRAIFPGDRVDASGWRHRAQGEALWHVALWLTGRGESFPALRRENHLRTEDLRWGQVIVVPPALLLPELRPAALAAGAQTGEKRQQKKIRVEEDRPAVVAEKGAAAIPVKSLQVKEHAPAAVASAPPQEARATAPESEVGPPRPTSSPSTRTDIAAPETVAAVPPRPPGQTPEPELGPPRPGSLVEASPTRLTQTPKSEVDPPRPVSSPSSRTDLTAPGTAVSVPKSSSDELVGPTVPASVTVPPPGEESVASPANAPALGETPEASGPRKLIYGRDAQGEYAAYSLRSGEALYSAVVVRFTGRTLADDVNALAAEVARRSGIDDVTSIPIGYAVKIPLGLLQPEFLPPGNPRRLEYEAAQNATRKFRNEVTALDLEGITVVLDAGHGGVDTGAMFGGVWESTYVYDIVLRVKHELETTTAARVIPTTRDSGDFRVEDRDVLGFSRGRAVLTSPPYPIEDSKVGVNLRWYLANSVERAALRRGASTDKVVFVSVHADSLHPSLRGATVYVPDAQMSGDAFERGGPEYTARREVRENPSEAVERRERQRSEGLSRDLAEHIVAGFRNAHLAVDLYKPVREHVIRGGRSWVPAVLRYNTIPAKVLVEVCNLGNPDDRALIQTRAFRQRVAESIARGLRAYYGKGHPSAPSAEQQIAKAAAKR